jgi:ligand-binding SRPBCC domain-containing protein
MDVAMSNIFRAEQWVAANREVVFRFFADPGNLPGITPTSSGARLVSVKLTEGSGREVGLAGKGSEVVISVRLLPWLPFRAQWTARITEFEYGEYFQDEQTRGPFQTWRHRHEFETAVRNGVAGTIIRDRVEYSPGFGWAGKIADVVAIRQILRSTFDHRHEMAARLLNAEMPNADKTTDSSASTNSTQ